MPLNPVRGQMYPFLNDYPFKGANRGYTFNPVGGECLHRCSYCFMKKGRAKNLKKYQGIARIDEKSMKDKLGSGNYVFVGSATDIFGIWVSEEIITRVLDYCKQFDNKYLFQSKNPHRFMDFLDKFPSKTILGTTVETNRFYTQKKYGNGLRIISPITLRIVAMQGIKDFEKMISVEPIMDFDLEEMINYIKEINPVFVSIGADSKKCGLPEPSADKIRRLIEELKKFTDVRIKPNLSRLMPMKVNCSRCGYYKGRDIIVR